MNQSPVSPDVIVVMGDQLPTGGMKVVDALVEDLGKKVVVIGSGGSSLYYRHLAQRAVREALDVEIDVLSKTSKEILSVKCYDGGEDYSRAKHIGGLYPNRVEGIVTEDYNWLAAPMVPDCKNDHGERTNRKLKDQPFYMRGRNGKMRGY